MYQSNTLNYIGLKYAFLIFGGLLLLMTIQFIVNPNAQVTVNGVQRPVETFDILISIIPAAIFLLLYLLFGRKVVKMTVNRNEFIFEIDGEEHQRKWTEVDELKRYWLVAPPVYSVTFNDGQKYYFNSGLMFIVTPFYVFDLSEMGKFILERRKDIEILKTLE